MKFIIKLIIVFFVVVLSGVGINYFITQRKAEKTKGVPETRRDRRGEEDL